MYVADWKFSDSYEGSTNQADFLAYFDLLDKVHAALHGWSGPNGCFSTLRRLNLTPDVNHDGIVNYILDYTTTIFDATADETTDYDPVNPDLEVNRGFNKPSQGSSPYVLPSD